MSSLFNFADEDTAQLVNDAGLELAITKIKMVKRISTSLVILMIIFHYLYLQ